MIINQNTMSKKHTIITTGAAIVFAAAGFFGGIKYQQAKAAKMFSARAGQFNGQAGGAGRRGGQGGDFVGGSVISKDEKSITVKAQDGGSKIVLLAPSTSIGKTATGTVEDLTIGAMVIVSGSANSDGSVTASNIQIRNNNGNLRRQ